MNTTTEKTQVIKDLKEKSILVSREFNAPLANVWRAYTEPRFLDQWWGPAPWRAETKTMNFSTGGYWLYVMVGPNNERHWGRMNYVAIDHHKTISIEDVFCDENGTVNTDLPVSKGYIKFSATATGTRVEFKTMYASEADVIKLIEMGFEQGFTMALTQLEAVLTNAKF
jgi:uncharacterized protein YndB with AHSA1/START domain